jgi:hypothetical protein
MGLPVPDPRVPDHTPAERELIDTILVLSDELRLLRSDISNLSPPSATKSEPPTVMELMVSLPSVSA